MMLFDAPLVPGLAYREELIEPVDEAELIRAIEHIELAPFKFQGWEGKRLTRSFGWRYDFDDRASHRSNRCPIGSCRCATRPPISEASSQVISSMRW